MFSRCTSHTPHHLKVATPKGDEASYVNADTCFVLQREDELYICPFALLCFYLQRSQI